MPDNPPAAKSACNGDHHYAHHVRGGEPLSIPICTLCGEIGWDDIREQIATAVLPAHRAMVLNEAVQAIEDITGSHVCDWTKGEALASIQDLAVAEPDTTPASTVEPENGPAVPDDGDGRAPNPAPPNTRPYCRRHGLDRDDSQPSDQRWVHLGWIGQTGALYSLDEYPSAHEPRFYPLWGREGIVILVPTQASPVAEPDTAEETP